MQIFESKEAAREAGVMDDAPLISVHENFSFWATWGMCEIFVQIVYFGMLLKAMS